jgi:glyoxylase-like metal-dependent hydrolase (beta-lactamase superfamily II)
MFGEELKPLDPTRLLNDGDKLELGELTLEIIHTPGHTPGSVCLYDRRYKFLFSGDTIFLDGIGRVDLPGGNEKAMRDSLGRIGKLGVKELFPGHGESGKIEESMISSLVKHLDM